MANYVTKWILEFGDKVTAPIKNMMKGVHSVTDSVDKMTNRVKYSEKEAVEALDNTKEHYKELTGEIKEAEKKLEELKEAYDKAVPGQGKLDAKKILEGQRKKVEQLNEILKETEEDLADINSQLNRLQSKKSGALTRWFKELKSAIPAVSLLTNPIVALTAGIYKMTNYVKASKEAYKAEAEQITKLTQVMRNTMGARSQEVKQLQDLMKVQQDLGVISTSVQSAGAQELATYLTKTSSAEKLLPVMNDMLAQQYGMNASQEQAINIASMMGKVMDGQVGALSRYGYKFDEAQEKILKYGTESQRAATLAEVVSSAVGGVNEALAQTPEGKMKKISDEMGGIQTRVGGLAVYLSTSMSGFYEKIAEVLGKVVAFFETYREEIFGVAQTVFNGLGNAVMLVARPIAWLVNKLREGNPYVVGITAAVAGFTAALMLHNAYTALATMWQNRLTLAVLKSNLAFLMNPIGLTVALIVGLIAAVIACWNKFEGFRQVVFKGWEAMKLFGTVIKDFVIDRLKGLLSGITGIGKALYKFFTGDWKGAWETGKQSVSDLMGIEAGKDAGKKFAKGWSGAMQEGQKKSDAYTAKKNAKKTSTKSINDLLDPVGPSFGSDDPAGDKKGKGKDGDGLNVGSGAGGIKSITMNLEVTNNFAVSKDTNLRDVADKVVSLVNDRMRDAVINMG